MARIEVLVAVGGDPAWRPGEIVDVDEATAEAWCDGVRARRAPDGWLTTEEARVAEEQRRQEGLKSQKAVRPPAGEKPAKAGPSGRQSQKAVRPPAGEKR